MSAATSTSTMDFATPGVQAGWTELMPKLFSLPGFSLVANVLAWQITRVLNKGIKDFENFFGSPRFAALPLEDRLSFAGYLFDGSEMLARQLKQLAPYRGTGLVRDFLISRFEAAVIRHGDFAETVGLAVDPDISALGKRLDDAL